MSSKSMKPISDSELKEVELNILLAVADFCEKNKLQYFVAYGTLLGAVRHQGFIPWDDDIDILMPRKDYNYLINNFNKLMRDTDYEAIVPFSPNSKHTFLKIGDKRTNKAEPEYRYNTETKAGMIDIDVFPLDGVPEDKLQYEKWYDELHLLYRAHFIKHRTFRNLSTREKIKMLLNKIKIQFTVSEKYIVQRTKELHDEYPYDKCSIVGSVDSFWDSKGVCLQKKWFENYTLVNFCGHEFKAPIGCHDVLTRWYGEYMKLPPEEARVSEHRMNVSWK